MAIPPTGYGSYPGTTGILPMALAAQQNWMRDIAMIGAADAENFSIFQQMLQKFFTANKKAQMGWIDAFGPAN